MTDDEIRMAYQGIHEGQPEGGCLTEAQLVSVAAGVADSSERQRIADHFVACGRCAEEYRLLTALKPWADEAAAVLSPEAVRAVAVSRPSSRWLAYAIAASLVLTLGVGFVIGDMWRLSQQLPSQDARGSTSAPADSRAAAPQAGVERVATEAERQLADARRQAEDLQRRSEDQQREIAALRRDRETVAAPEPNVAIVELEPADTFRSNPERARTIELASSVKLVTFVINAGPTDPSSSYDIDMADRDGRVIWTSSGLRQSAGDTFTVAVPRALLPPGQGYLRLYTHRGNRRELVENYPVRFAYQ